MSKYYLTKKQAKLYFDTINLIIFNNVLPQFDQIKRMKPGQDLEYYAYVDTRYESDYCALWLKKNYRSKDFAFLLIAHQMVHLYQVKILKEKPNTQCHGNSFYCWAQKFEKHNLCLDQMIDLHDDKFCQGIADQMVQKAKKCRIKKYSKK